MGRRVRLTQRRRRRAVEDDTPYPGTVNQPGRKFKKRDQYDNWEEVVNHPLPDMRHEWKNEKRDEIGFGIPTVASIRAAASKAVRLAVLLLGDKVDEDVIEAQARTFMKLGNKGLNESLERFSETETVYSQDEEEETAQDEEEKKEEETAQDEEEKKEETAQDEEEKKEEETAQDEEEKKEASKKKSQDEDEAVEKDEDVGEEAQEEEEKKSSVDMDIELNSITEGSEEISSESEKLLGKLFSQDEEEETAQDEEEEKAQDEEEEKAQDENQNTKMSSKKSKKAAKKQGVKSLGGQVKVASDMSTNDISKIWDDAPDVSSVFK